MQRPRFTFQVLLADIFAYKTLQQDKPFYVRTPYSSQPTISPRSSQLHMCMQAMPVLPRQQPCVRCCRCGHGMEQDFDLLSPSSGFPASLSFAI